MSHEPFRDSSAALKTAVLDLEIGKIDAIRLRFNKDAFADANGNPPETIRHDRIK
ncbi:hypothetical protein [Sporisorium scitamineum]|uniref:Uncharacterized protein n=1 Tax=Sporisorium scitamineum TaxID=49012 RepID=A0A0F7S6G1_9BASI|nr:hypothetical protein [Sporisorium scitamineum]